MSNDEAFTCQLSEQDARRREEADRALVAELARYEWEDDRHAVLTFAPSSEHLVREFVREESSCCSFFDFDVRDTGDAVRLRVSAPHGAERMLQALVGAFGS
ncbi:hypothetical protein H0B56_18225 [Haloechinothrix sp. YIM 98757]|uniref:Uncharacterized protein n=1 Tax=Haloechinothrix aidingensis TaxID=2752311 RepID=A0A838ADV8_9PSEU|nr:hypothetical protein [Haloechinothrix aidingensis]MBA0127486.1 hypothetical protein [Haloechinothrix aidingensis]